MKIADVANMLKEIGLNPEVIMFGKESEQFDATEPRYEVKIIGPRRLMVQLMDTIHSATSLITSWQPIQSAPMDRPILIRERKGYLPDLVRWQCRRPERIVGGTKHLSVPAGWFCLQGGRSHIINPTEWMDIQK